MLRQYPGLALFVASRFCSGIGLTMIRATVSWQVYAISGSAFQLGLVGLVQFLPALGLGLVGGAVADTHDRRRIVMLCQGTAMAGSAVLFATTAAGSVSLPVIYGLVLLLAVAAAFENPARSAMLPQLVPRELFPRAVNLYTATQMLAFMTGPVITGFLIAAAGVAAPYALHVGVMVGAILFLFPVRVRRPQEPGRGVSLQAIGEGLAFVWRQPVVLGCMTLDMFAVLFGGAVALLPIYAKEILAVGARGYGVLSSSLEVGAVLMAGVLMLLPPVQRTGRALLIAVATFGVATVVFGFSRSFPISLAAYMTAGMADYVSMVMRGTAIQLSTPDALRGRVSSVNMLFIGASNQLGAAESGFVAALTNPTFSVVSGGLGALLVVLLVTLRNPTLRRYEAQG